MNLIERDLQNIWHPFTPQKGFPYLLPVKSAKGCCLHLEDGRKILDAISSWWVNLHGHSHPYLAEALSKQANELEHVIFAGFTHEPAITLAERLLKILPANQSKIFFSDNGSTAVEVALKMALQYFWNQGLTKKTKIIAFEGAYHGDTFGAMSAGERSPFVAAFLPLLFEVEFLPLPDENNFELVKNQFYQLLENNQVAAFIFEPIVQGAAGMRMYEAKFLDHLIKIAQDNNVLCIADEVMTGFGRTGTLFASYQLRNQPDIFCLSKGLTGGMMAMGITSCSSKVYEAFYVDDFYKTFFHGHSFTANPLACAVANASLDLLLKKECQEKIQWIGEQHDSIKNEAIHWKRALNVRSKGTIFALELNTTQQTSYFNEARSYLYPIFIEKGVLLRPLGNTIYVLPPYCIDSEELNFVYSAIREVMEM
ncbi:MAG: adenosylmethionine--8-amino-7-oxononanoate transaminase [Flammeovirgaceae bacterium]